MFALPTMQTAVLDIAHFLWVPAPEHLVHEFIIVALIVPRIDVLEPVPVLDKDLFEDVPVPRRFCNHQDAPSWSIGIVAVQLFTTPHQRSPPPPRPSQRNAHPPLSSWSHEDFRAAEKWKFLYDPVPRRFCNHQDAPSWSIGIVAVQLFTTPHQRR